MKKSKILDVVEEKMEPIIKVKNLEKVYKTHRRDPGLANALKSIFKRKYEQKHALKGISFTVRKGEVLGLIGPNGAGKSTAIKTLSGVLFPSNGEVEVLGYIPWQDRTKYVYHIGVVFGQKPQLLWDLPPIDSFYLNKELYDIPRDKFDARLNYMTRLLNVQDVMKTPTRDLSLGERMKCKIIAALLHNPKLVLLDEPSIGLDIIAKDRLRDFIKQVNRKEKTTFIVTTHDMQDIERLCKRIIIINHGKIVYDGLLKDIKERFMDKKVLTVKFETKAPGFMLKGCKVIKRRKYELKIEVDLKKQKVKNVIDYILTKSGFADLLISDPSIEEIIQRIYEAKESE